MNNVNKLLAKEYKKRIKELDEKVKSLDNSLQEKQKSITQQDKQHKAYIVEPFNEGASVFVHKKDKKVLISNGGEVYDCDLFVKGVKSLSSDDFILSATLTNGTLIINDVIYFKNKDLSFKSFYKRKKLLKGFCWENARKNILLNEYTIVKSPIDLKKSCEFYSLDHKRISIKNYDEKGFQDAKTFIFEDKTFELKKLLSLSDNCSLELDRFGDHELITNFVNVIGSSTSQGVSNELILQINMVKPVQGLVDSIEESILNSIDNPLQKKIVFVWGAVEVDYDSMCPIYNLCLTRAKPKIINAAQKDRLMNPFKLPEVNNKIGTKEELSEFFKTNIKQVIFEKVIGEEVCLHKNADEFFIFSTNGDDLTLLFWDFKEDIAKLTKQDIILICEVIVEAKVIKQIIVKDVVYFNKSLFKTQFYERKKALNALSFSDKLVRADPFVVGDNKDLESALDKLGKKFMLKRWDAPYSIQKFNEFDILVDIK